MSNKGLNEGMKRKLVQAFGTAREGLKMILSLWTDMGLICALNGFAAVVSEGAKYEASQKGVGRF